MQDQSLLPLTKSPPLTPLFVRPHSKTTMDKYNDLPDIDRDGQEIFETSDVESTEELVGTHEQSGDNNPPEVNVDHLPINAKDSFVKTQVIINANVPDFLGNISHQLSSSGYYVTEVDETIDEKLCRIARELEEIKLDKEMAMTTPKQTEDVNQLLKLLNSLKCDVGVDDKKREEIISNDQLRIDDIFNRVKDNDEKGHRSLRSDNIKRLVQLEERLSFIEGVIGEEVLVVGVGKKPIMSIQNKLNDLERKISIVNNPEYTFDVIDNQLVELNKEMEQLEMRKKLFNLSDIYNTSSMTMANDNTDKVSSEVIQSLVDKLPDITKNNETVPLVINRLKTLNKIHQEIDGHVQLARNIDQLLTDLKSDVSQWDGSLTKVYEQIEQHNKNFEDNQRSLVDRMNQLVSKIDALEDSTISR